MCIGRELGNFSSNAWDKGIYIFLVKYEISRFFIAYICINSGDFLFGKLLMIWVCPFFRKIVSEPSRRKGPFPFEHKACNTDKETWPFKLILFLGWWHSIFDIWHIRSWKDLTFIHNIIHNTNTLLYHLYNLLYMWGRIKRVHH